MGAALSRSVIEVGIVVDDLRAQTHFYGESLGLALLGEIPTPSGRMVRFDAGGSVVKLLAMDDAPSGPVPAAGSLGLQYVSLYVDNLDELVADLQQAGTVIETGVTEVRAGVRFAFVRDREGNRIELLDIPE